ncbi:hypothetical protein niasHT_024201 [Heterodera trifolii]|uniref:Uncharacterized protein n=1 Tax=Heterodera trifolii TaxID=157864 RepID=A0ABD2JLX0_9BILA
MEAIQRDKCRRIATLLEDNEQFDQSAVCHREIAAFCSKLGNLFMERRHLLKAAKLYYCAQMMIQRTNSECSAEFGKLMEQCYLEVIHGLLKSESSFNYFSIVGLVHFELAIQLNSLKKPFKAFIYLRRANRFVQGNLPLQIQIIENLCNLVLTIGKEHSAQVLFEVDSIWLSLPKREGMRERMLSLEARIILLHLKQRKEMICSTVSSVFSLKRHFLSTYEGNWKDIERKSVTTEKEFQLFSRFISSIQNDNFVESSHIYAVQLEKLLDLEGKEICNELIDSLNFNEQKDSETDEIFASSEMLELEKRDKIFEILNNFTKFAKTPHL